MKNITAKYIGLITGFLMILAEIILFYKFKLPVNGKTQFIGYSIFIVGLVGSLLIYKSNNRTDENLKNYFSQGFKTFIVVALLMAVYAFIFYKLNPQILETAIIESDKMVIQNGDHTPAEIAKNASMLRNMFVPMMVVWSSIKYMLIGALVSIIGAGLLSQKRN